MSPAVVILAGGQGERIGGNKPSRLLAGERLVDRALRLHRAPAPAVVGGQRHARRRLREHVAHRQDARPPRDPPLALVRREPEARVPRVVEEEVVVPRVVALGRVEARDAAYDLVADVAKVEHRADRELEARLVPDDADRPRLGVGELDLRAAVLADDHPGAVRLLFGQAEGELRADAAEV